MAQLGKKNKGADSERQKIELKFTRASGKGGMGSIKWVQIEFRLGMM